VGVSSVTNRGPPTTGTTATATTTGATTATTDTAVMARTCSRSGPTWTWSPTVNM
jgi:hypothetical protein